MEEQQTIRSVEDLGRILRARRKAQKLTIHNAAALAGCSVQFLHDLESGKPSIQMGRALEYARKLGLRFDVAAPQETPEPPARARPR